MLTVGFDRHVQDIMHDSSATWLGRTTQRGRFAATLHCVRLRTISSIQIFCPKRFRTRTP